MTPATTARARYGDVMITGADASAALVPAAVQRTPRIGIDRTPSGRPAWTRVPAHYLIASDDRALDPATQAELAHRMGARVDTVAAPHAAMLTHPGEVTRFLVDVVSSTTGL